MPIHRLLLSLNCTKAPKTVYPYLGIAEYLACIVISLIQIPDSRFLMCKPKKKINAYDPLTKNLLIGNVELNLLIGNVELMYTVKLEEESLTLNRNHGNRELQNSITDYLTRTRTYGWWHGA